MSRPSNRPYFRAPNLGPDCSTQRSARLRERRFAMAYEGRAEPPEYTQLAEQAKRIYLEHEGGDTTASGLEMPDPFGAAPRLRPGVAGRSLGARPTGRRISGAVAHAARRHPETTKATPPATSRTGASALLRRISTAPNPSLARAKALRHVVDHCEITVEEGTVFLGGEDPFFFNLLLPALQADGHSREGQIAPDEASGRLRAASAFYAACFDGHITPGLDDILSQGVVAIRARVEDRLAAHEASGSDDESKRQFWEAGLLSCDSLLEHARRYRDEALRLAEDAEDPESAAELRSAAEVLSHVPEHAARTFHEALQSYWLAYILVTLEMGGCCPGGGLGLGRPDQYLYPYYERDIREGRLTREAALELVELFLLCFRHVDYYTPHQIFTPGSHGSLGGVTPAGADASNELTELIMEASLRIAMPAPYLSVRLHPDAPERYWQAAANYVAGGLGFPVVNDEALIPAMLRHGRSLEDARDYICSCCYENTIPGREAFHPNASYLNLPLVLELALNGGASVLSGEALGEEARSAEDFGTFEALMAAFGRQLHYVCDRLVALVNASDRSHMQRRRYPMMSLFMDHCIASGTDVCAGGCEYNLTGCIVAGLPDVVNALAAIRHCVFERQALTMAELVAALRNDFEGHENVRRQLLAAPKWGNGEAEVDELAEVVADRLYEEFRHRENPRGGRWQVALYSFVANHHLGSVVGASADGRRAGEPLTRNLNPTWGTDRQGPTAVLRSLSHIDFTKFPNGSALDLVFDPAPLQSEAGREKFAAFLKTFVDLGVMEMQISMVDGGTLRDAQEHPERYPHLMVKAAGYSARFVDLPSEEQTELIERTTQRLG